MGTDREAGEITISRSSARRQPLPEPMRRRPWWLQRCAAKGQDGRFGHARLGGFQDMGYGTIRTRDRDLNAIPSGLIELVALYSGFELSPDCEENRQA